MRYLNVSDEYVANILEAAGLKSAVQEPIVEAEGAATEDTVETVNEETETHTCPLCESKLEEALSDVALKECVDFIMDTMNELNVEEGEALVEEFDTEDESQED
tara:strand:- start:5851 stop:6162 length:312 start_codon:yes stop_codon:yes gene_type:complete